MFRLIKARRAKHLTVAVLSATVIASALFMNDAFAQDSPSASGAPSKVIFTYADVAEPSSLNPMVGYLGTDYTFWAMTYDLPINFSTKDFSPDYAHSIVTSVDASSDGMSFTYHFRSGVKWSDGQPFTAADAAWTLNYYKTNNVPNYSADLALMDKATATDDTTMVLTSTQPDVVLLRRVRLHVRVPPARAHLGEVPGRLQGREAADRVPVGGYGAVHHHELRQEPVRAAGPQPQLLGERRRSHAARRPDHLPDLRQPGRRSRRPPVGRGRLRLLLVGEHPEHAEDPRTRDARRSRPELR